MTSWLTRYVQTLVTHSNCTNTPHKFHEQCHPSARARAGFPSPQPDVRFCSSTGTQDAPRSRPRHLRHSSTTSSPRQSRPRSNRAFAHGAGSESNVHMLPQSSTPRWIWDTTIFRCRCVIHRASAMSPSRKADTTTVFTCHYVSHHVSAEPYFLHRIPSQL